MMQKMYRKKKALFSKILWAAMLALISILLLLSYHAALNHVPDFADKDSFDPFRYELTHETQSFRLKPHDRHWRLSSFTSFSADGAVKSQQEYALDGDNAAYYPVDDQPCYLGRIPSVGYYDFSRFLSQWDVEAEDFDQYGRVTDRKASHPRNKEHAETIQFYYRTDQPGQTGDDALCTLVRTTETTVPDGEETWIYDVDGEPLYGSVSYEIQTLDLYGNVTSVWVEGASCLIRDSAGYLQMIVQPSINAKNRLVTRVDEYGRPLWMAEYDWQDGGIVGYSVWEYEELGPEYDHRVQPNEAERLQQAYWYLQDYDKSRFSWDDGINERVSPEGEYEIVSPEGMLDIGGRDVIRVRYQYYDLRDIFDFPCDFHVNLYFDEDWCFLGTDYTSSGMDGTQQKLAYGQNSDIEMYFFADKQEYAVGEKPKVTTILRNVEEKSVSLISYAPKISYVGVLQDGAEVSGGIGCAAQEIELKPREIFRETSEVLLIDRRGNDLPADTYELEAMVSAQQIFDGERGMRVVWYQHKAIVITEETSER